MATPAELLYQMSLLAPSKQNMAAVQNAISRGVQTQQYLSIKADRRSFNQVNKDLNEIAKNATVARSNVEEIGRVIGTAARRFGAISLATGTFVGLARAIKGSISEAVQFERELAKIAQATDSSISSTKALSNQVFALSQAYGTAQSELVKFGRIFAQAGFNAKQTAKSLEILSKTDLIGTFGKMEDTAEGIIAVLQQFGREARKTGSEIQFIEKSFDSINRVAKKFAVESEDIVEAIRKTGGVFESAGGQLNELIALIAAVRSTTRESAETIANGFKTIFTRIQRKDTLDSLRQLGVELEDAQGKFVGPMKAIEMLSARLNSLDKGSVKFTNIVEEIGGVYQIGRLITAIRQVGLAREALNEAQNAGGDIDKDVAIQTQTLATQFEKLTQRFNTFVNSLTQESSFRNFAKMLIDIGDAMINIGDSLRPLLPLIENLSALIAIRLGAQAFRSLSGMNKQIKKTAEMAGTDGPISAPGFVPTSRYMQGGPVRGSKSSRTDTVPAMLAENEYVLRSKAVKQLGLDTLNKLNSGNYSLLDVALSKKSFFSNTLSGRMGYHGQVADVMRKTGLKSLEDLYDLSNPTDTFIAPSINKVPLRYPDGRKIPLKDVIAMRDKVAAQSLASFKAGGPKAANAFLQSSLGSVPVSVTNKTFAESGRLFQFVTGIQGAIGELMLRAMDPSFQKLPNKFGIDMVSSDGRFAEVKATGTRQSPITMIGKALIAIARLVNPLTGFKNNKADSINIPETTFYDTVQRFNTGGVVGGTGSGDKIPALLEPGEVVVNKRAAKQVGYDVFHAMNRGSVGMFSEGYVPKGTRKSQIQLDYEKMSPEELKSAQDQRRAQKTYMLMTSTTTSNIDEIIKKTEELFGKVLPTALSDFKQTAVAKGTKQFVPGGQNKLTGEENAPTSGKKGTLTRRESDKTADIVGGRKRKAPTSDVPIDPNRSLRVEAYAGAVSRGEPIPYNANLEPTPMFDKPYEEKPAQRLSMRDFMKKKSSEVGSPLSPERIAELNQARAKRAAASVRSARASRVVPYEFPGTGNDSFKVYTKPKPNALLRNESLMDMVNAAGGMPAQPKSSSLSKATSQALASLAPEIAKELITSGNARPMNGPNPLPPTQIRTPGALGNNEAFMGMVAAAGGAPPNPPNKNKTPRGTPLTVEEIAQNRAADQMNRRDYASQQRSGRLAASATTVPTAPSFLDVLDKVVTSTQKSVPAEKSILEKVGLDSEMTQDEKNATKSRRSKIKGSQSASVYTGRGVPEKLLESLYANKDSKKGPGGPGGPGGPNSTSGGMGDEVEQTAEKFDLLNNRIGLLTSGAIALSLAYSQVGEKTKDTVDSFRVFQDSILAASVAFATFQQAGGIFQGFGKKLEEKLNKIPFFSKMGAGRGAARVGSFFNTGVMNGIGLGIAGGSAVTGAIASYRSQNAEISKRKADQILNNVSEGTAGQSARSDYIENVLKSQDMSLRSSTGASAGYTGAVGGAIAGAAIGSVIPVVGTAIGGVVGGVVGGVAGGVGGSYLGSRGIEETSTLEDSIVRAADAQYMAAESAYSFSKAMKESQNLLENSQARATRLSGEVDPFINRFSSIKENTAKTRANLGMVRAEQSDRDQWTLSNAFFNRFRKGLDKDKLIEQAKTSTEALDSAKSQASEISGALRSALSDNIQEALTKSTTLADAKNIGNTSSIKTLVKNLSDLAAVTAVGDQDQARKKSEEALTKYITEASDARVKELMSIENGIKIRENEIIVMQKVTNALDTLQSSGQALSSAKSLVNIRTGKGVGGIERGLFGNSIDTPGNLKALGGSALAAGSVLGQDGIDIAGKYLNSVLAAKDVKSSAINNNLLNSLNSTRRGSLGPDRAEVEKVLGASKSFTGLDKAVQDSVITKLTEELSKGKLNLSQIDETVKIISDSAKGYASVLDQAASQQLEYVDLIAEQNNNLNEAISRRSEIDDRDFSIDARGDSRLRQVNAGRMSLADTTAADALTDQNNRLEVNRRTGVSIFGGKNLNAALNAQQALSAQQKQIRQNEDQLANPNLDASTRAKLVVENQNLAKSAGILRQEMEKLTDQTDKASGVMDRIQKVRAIADYQSQNVSNFISGSDEERMRQLEVGGALQAALAQGTFQMIPDDLRKEAFSKAEEIAKLDPNSQFADAFGKAKVNDAKFFAAQFGQKLTPDMENALMGKATSAEDKLINELQSIKDEEKAFNDALRTAEMENTQTMKDLLSKLQSLVPPAQAGAAPQSAIIPLPGVNNLNSTLNSVSNAPAQDYNSVISGMNNVANTLSSIAASFNNMTMTHTLNVDGQLNLGGINSEVLATQLRDALGEYIGNIVKEQLNQQSKTFRTA